METKQEQLSDFNQIDQALLLFLVELYRSLHLHNSVAAQTANRMFQFLAVATAAFGALAISFLIRNEIADLVVSGLILLLLPATIHILYLIWLREQLRLLRNSVFLLGLERKISHYLYLVQPAFQASSKPARRASYITIQKIFGPRFMDWEIWVRGKKPGQSLEEREIFRIIIAVFFTVAASAAMLGIALLTMAYDQGCTILNASASRYIDFSKAKSFSFIVQFLQTPGMLRSFWPFYWPMECVFRPAYVVVTAIFYLELFAVPALYAYTRAKVRFLDELAKNEKDRWTLLDGSPVEWTPPLQDKR